MLVLASTVSCVNHDKVLHNGNYWMISHYVFNFRYCCLFTANVLTEQGVVNQPNIKAQFSWIHHIP